MMNDHALLLINLGSPDSPSTSDVKNYLNQFLMDPYVIQLPWPIRRLLVSFILSTRPAASAHAYQTIWRNDGSPLISFSQQLQQKIQSIWTVGPTKLAMRYGQPSIEQALVELAHQGITQITLAPLYPHFAQSTVITAIEEVNRVIKHYQFKFKLQQLMPFYEHPLYINALHEVARPFLQQPFDHVLFSFHGLPVSHISKLIKDKNHNLAASHSNQVKPENMPYCYRSQCLRTAELFVAESKLNENQWSISFQSRLGRAKWLEPYTTSHIDHLLRQGVKRLLVLCPAFTADCLETLEEIDIQARQQFLEGGGTQFTLIPCLNDHPQWVTALHRLCQSELIHAL